VHVTADETPTHRVDHRRRRAEIRLAGHHEHDVAPRGLEPPRLLHHLDDPERFDVGDPSGQSVIHRRRRYSEPVTSEA
jgi:hypothetical protein